MTDRELAAQAEAHLRRTTVSYPEWVRRRAAGKYADDGAGTEWGKAFASLEQIGVVEEPPPPPPPSGSILFDGRFDTGNTSRWPATSGTVSVIDTPSGKMLRAVTNGDASGKLAGIVHVGNSFEAYQLPFEIIPSDVWHGFTVVVPNGQHAGYPGRLITPAPGSGWSIAWEVHNRTDPQSGYNYPGTAWWDPNKPKTPDNYLSTVLNIKGETDGRIGWVLRISGGTLNGTVHTATDLLASKGEAIQYNRVYRHAIRLKHGHTPQTGFYEWWMDGVKRAEGAVPTAFLV